MHKRSLSLIFLIIIATWVILMTSSCAPEPVYAPMAAEQAAEVEEEFAEEAAEMTLTPFLYVAVVHEMDTVVAISDAKVSIEVEGKKPLAGITDVDGFAEIAIDEPYIERLGSLIVDAEGYKQHKIDVIVSEYELPYDVSLEPISVSKTTGEPTDEPAGDPNVTPTETSTPIAPPSVPARLVVTELGDNLRCRKSPGTSSKDDSDIVTKFAKGIIITIIDGPVSQDDFTWWQVELPDEQTCWVAAGDAEGDWIVPVATATP